MQFKNVQQMDVMGQRNAQNALTRSNNPQKPLHKKLGGPHSTHVRGEEIIPASIGKRTSRDQLHQVRHG
jgi:hypothetical protein